MSRGWPPCGAQPQRCTLFAAGKSNICGCARALVFLHHLCAPLIAQGAARARKRRARRAAQKVAGGVFYDENDFAEHEEESNIGDFHVRWEDLADALIALPLGLNVEDVKKILLLTDSTGSGHCSLRKFERTFLGLGAIIGRARVSFKKR